MANRGGGGHKGRGFLGNLLILLLPFLAIDEFAEFLGVVGLVGGEKKGIEGEEEAARGIFRFGCLFLLVLFISPFGIVFLAPAVIAFRSGSGLVDAVKVGLACDFGLVVGTVLLFGGWTAKKLWWNPPRRAKRRARLILAHKPDMSPAELRKEVFGMLGEDDARARKLADDAASDEYERYLKQERRRQQQQAAGAQGQRQRRESWGQRLRRWKQTLDRFRVPPPPPRRR